MDQELFAENERTAPVAGARKFADVGSFTTESGGFIPSVTVAYETWGKLNTARDNAILVCHAVSGDSHAIGWWGKLIGPGKPIDTNRFYVIGNNLLGGCQGTTGPSSLAPDGKPYGSRFPVITVQDMVEVQKRLVSFLGVENLHAAVGGSMGGFVVSDWTIRFPGFIKKAFITASCPRSTPMQIGFHEVSRQAICRDPNWNGGDYYDAAKPSNGLALARMLGHLTYLSPAAFEAKFGRRLQDRENIGYTWDAEFQVESYLRHQGEGFTKRFDANSYLWISKAMDYFSLESFDGSQTEYLFACFKSDWFYPPSMSLELHQMALNATCKSTYLEVDLPYGHDAFLLDGEIQGKALADFLANCR